jgi:hypothetical protein
MLLFFPAYASRSDKSNKSHLPLSVDQSIVGTVRPLN